MDEMNKIGLSDLISGDCLLYKGRSLLSRAIRLFTAYSHAAIVVRPSFATPLANKPVIYTVEAVAEGVELTNTDKLSSYKGEIHVFRPDALLPSRRSCIVLEAFHVVSMNIGYDFEGLFANIFGRVSMDARRYFCSEFVWEIWKRCNVVPATLSKKAPRPGDIPKLVKGQLFKLEVQDGHNKNI